jgi:hypothetical protein
VAVVITLLLVFSMGMLLRIAWSGMVFDVPSDGATKEPDGQSQPSGQGPTPAKAGKRA